MRTRPRPYLGALLLLLLALGAFAAAPPALHGQTAWPCDEVVVDPDGILGEEIGQVRAAADRLIAQGADVRVLAVQTTGMGDVEPYVAEIVKACPRWQAADGDLKKNLIILSVSVQERRAGLYFGGDWYALLQPHYLRIQSETINALFAEGDYAGGLIAGLDEIAGLIDAQRHPPTAAPAPTAVPAAGGGTAASPGTGLAVAGVLGGLAVLGGATAGGVVFYRTRVARRRAQQRARELKMKVTDRILRLPEEITFAEVEMTNLKGRVVKEEYRHLPKKLTEARRLIEQVNADSQNIQMAGTDPDREGLTREEYEGFAASFQELLALLDQAGHIVAEVRSQIQALQDLPDQLPEAVEQAQAAVETVRSQVAERSPELPNRQAEQLLGQAQEKIAESRKVGKKKRPRKAMNLLDEVQPLLDQAVAVSGLLPPLRDRIAQVDSTLEEGEAVFMQMAAQHADAAWQTVRGNGTEADNRLAWAREALGTAGADLSSDEPERWAAVPEQVQQAQAWLDEAVALVQSIHDHRQHLEQARQAAPQEVQRVKDDIVKAREYIHQYDRDIREQLEHELDAAEPDWGLVYKELGQERPDYPGVLNLVRGVHKVADRILAEARSEHEGIKRLTQRYSGVLRELQGTLSSTGNYLRDHFGDVGRDARASLQQAEQTLRFAEEQRGQAERQEDTARRKSLAEAVELLQEAGAQADRAYARARQDVARAEEARRPPPVSSPPAGPDPFSWSGGWGTPRPNPPAAPRPKPSPGGHSGGSSTGWGSLSSGGTHSGGSSTGWGPSTRRRGGGSTGW